MTFTPKVWKDFPDPEAQIFAADLIDLEERLSAHSESNVWRVTNESEVLEALGDAESTPGVTLQASKETDYFFNSQLDIPEGTAIRGGGRSTRFHFSGCHGLVFEKSDYIGPQIFEDIYIQGDGTYGFDAVKALGDADAGRIQGVKFRDVVISHFRRGFDLRSTHGWHINHVAGHHLWEAVKVAGQTILLTIDGGSEFSRDAATGVGESVGFKIKTLADYNPGGITEKGPEGTRLRDSTFFGFQVGVDHESALDTVYDGLTLGMVGHTGIRIANRQGNLRFRDSWIGYDNGAIFGIDVRVLGTPNVSNLLIEGNHAAVEAGKTTDASSVGCTVEANQGNVSIRNNTFRGSRLHDIRLNFAGECWVEENICESTTAGASIQLVAFPGGPYHIGHNSVATNIFQHASNTGFIDFQGRMAVPAANVPINTIFKDSSDNKLKFKDGSGVVQALY